MKNIKDYVDDQEKDDIVSAIIHHTCSNIYGFDIEQHLS